MNKRTAKKKTTDAKKTTERGPAWHTKELTFRGLMALIKRYSVVYVSAPTLEDMAFVRSLTASARYAVENSIPVTDADNLCGVFARLYGDQVYISRCKEVSP